MYRKITLLGLLIVSLASCKKYNVDPLPVETGTPTSSPSEVFQLKDIVVPRLPSPYYHFEYGDNGKMKVASFASDFFRYDVKYQDQAVSEMKNTVFNSNSSLRFVYDGSGRINTVNYLDNKGKIKRRAVLTYNGPMLIELQQEGLIDNNFVVVKTLSMSYYADSNLSELKMHYPALNGNKEINLIYTYSEYDNNINVDGFSLLHNEFFDQLIFLPGVRLQKNNHRKETLTGGNNYNVEYTYQYNDKNLPVSRAGDLLFTSGTDSGKHFQLSTFYSYY